MNNEYNEAAYGKEQNIKMDIMKMVNEGMAPYDIILYVAGYLERTSGEEGYAANLRECINSVYGVGLGNEKPLSDELSEVRARCHRMEESLSTVDVDDVKKRIIFAIEHHKKFAAFLEKKIEKAKH